MKYTILFVWLCLSTVLVHAQTVTTVDVLGNSVVKVVTTNPILGLTTQTPQTLPTRTVQQTATVLITEPAINGPTGSFVQTTVIVTPSIKATQTNVADGRTMTVVSVSGQPRSSSGSKARLAGIISGVVGALIICLVVLLYIRRRMIRKEATAGSKLHAAPHRNEHTVMPLSLTEASGQRSRTGKHNQRQAEATGNRTKAIAPVSNTVSESSQAIVEPTSSMVQEMDSLRARIADLERQRQQGARRNSHPPSINSNGTGDNQSAPPAYSDYGRQ